MTKRRSVGGGTYAVLLGGLAALACFSQGCADDAATEPTALEDAGDRRDGELRADAPVPERDATPRDAGAVDSMVDATADVHVDAWLDAISSPADASTHDADVDAPSAADTAPDASSDANAEARADATADAASFDAAHDGQADATDASVPATANLLANGGAEMGSPVDLDSGASIAVPSWIAAGNATVVAYGSSGFLSASDPGPVDRGNHFFSGGLNDATSQLSQRVHLGPYAASVAQGGVRFVLAAYMGGWEMQTDAVAIAVTFRDGVGAPLAAASLAPVTPGDRVNISGLLFRSEGGVVPAGAVFADVVIDMIRTAGNNNDAYADNISFVLTGI